MEHPRARGKKLLLHGPELREKKGTRKDANREKNYDGGDEEDAKFSLLRARCSLSPLIY